MEQFNVITAASCTPVGAPERSPDQEQGDSGGYAFLTTSENRPPLQASFGRSRTTINRLELLAVIHAIDSIQQRLPRQTIVRVGVHTSSDYVWQGYPLGVHHSNQDLWDELYQRTVGNDVSISLVPARSTPELKMIAMAAVRKSGHRDLPRDRGYRPEQDQSRP